MNPSSPLMTATYQAIEAASVGDMAALKAALAARRAALMHASASERAVASREAEPILSLIRGIKRRIGEDYHRLERIKTVLVQAAVPPPATIDLRA